MERHPHPSARHSLHRAAAADGGNQAWSHRVAASTSADESLAEALESAAARDVPADSGLTSPATLLEWACDLSVDPRDRERRLLMAALHRVFAGDLGPAELWTRVESCPPSPLRDCALAGRALLTGRTLDARFQLSRAMIACRNSDDGELVAFIHGVRAALDCDAALGERAIAEAQAGLARVRRYRALHRWLGRLLAAGTCYTAGPRSALAALAWADDEYSWWSGRPPTQEPSAAIELGSYLALAGEPDESMAALSELAGSHEGDLPGVLHSSARLWFALACHLAGAWREAEHSARAAIGPSRQPARAQGACHALLAILAAHRGDWTAATAQLQDARYLSEPERPDDLIFCDIAEVTIADARAVLTAEHPALHRLSTAPAGRKYGALWLALRAEALVETGAEADALIALSELRSLAKDVPYLSVAYGRLAGRLDERRRDPHQARRHYEAALELPEECLVVPFEIGLLQHCYGRLLCDLGDPASGTTWLSQAHSRLRAIGAFTYARRCAVDLSARQLTLESAGPAGTLTDRERAVAQLVAAGLTNQQVAARLYVSAKTVEYHLAQIYAKLGIRSRRQLAPYLP